MLRIQHACATVDVPTPPEAFFNAYSRWAQYEQWAPGLQGPAHWLHIRQGGLGSQFVLYDKPGPRHLVHFGTVTEFDPYRRFAWRAPFGEWSRIFVGTVLDVVPTTSGSRVTETLFVDAGEDHLPVAAAFFGLPGYDAQTMSALLEARLRGLDRLIQSGELSEAATGETFAENVLVAADWSGRISTGHWVRVLYADGLLNFDAPPEVVFNNFTRFARYRDWTPMIHVGAEWLDIRAGGVGSKFLLWEKPGDRQVMHYAAVTELVRNQTFTWRAPFADWGKVFIGTSMKAEPTSDGGTRVYHVLYIDLPEEYLPVFAGFGALGGYDLAFETFHIYEEARGFNQLLQTGAFSGADQSYLFDVDRRLALDWPRQDGRPWPEETLSLQPDRIITYERMIVELAEILAEAIPSPAFMRTYRNLARTQRYNGVNGHERA